MSVSLLEFALTATPPPFVPTLISSALSPEQFAQIFQPIVAQILGVVTAPAPWAVTIPSQQSWYQVRIGWQQQGQPAWTINEDVCILMATIDDQPFSRMRDGYLEQNDNRSLVQQMSFTQIWKLHFTLYGPNSYRNANQISSQMAQDWVHDTLANANVFQVSDVGQGLYARPINNPEQKDGQWWQRVDLDLKFNYLVNESIVIPCAAGVGVTVLPQPGAPVTFTIEVSN